MNLCSAHLRYVADCPPCQPLEWRGLDIKTKQVIKDYWDENCTCKWVEGELIGKELCFICKKFEGVW